VYLCKMLLSSKLPGIGTSIFTVISALAQEHNAINLGQGFPDYPTSEHLMDLVNKYMRQGYNQYAPMPGVMRLRERIAEKIEGMYGVNIDPDQEITITSGASEALFSAIACLIRPGDEVIIFEPAYDLYRPAVEVFGGVVKTYELQAPDFQVNWNHLKRLMSSKTRLIIINNPHNPSGRVFKDSDMLELEKFLDSSHDLFIVSDEAYEHLIFDGLEHQSVLRYPRLRERAFAAFSFGKTFHNTGWKVGYCVAPPALTKEFRKVHQFNVFSVNTPMQHAFAEFLEDPIEYLSLSTFFTHKRDLFLDIIEKSRFTPLACEGTYFQTCLYERISDEKDLDLCKRLTTELGVAAIPFSAFYTNGTNQNIIRFCFAKKDETLERAGELLLKV
jgi:methionine transaminase